MVWGQPEGLVSVWTRGRSELPGQTLEASPGMWPLPKVVVNRQGQPAGESQLLGSESRQCGGAKSPVLLCPLPLPCSLCWSYRVCASPEVWIVGSDWQCHSLSAWLPYPRSPGCLDHKQIRAPTSGCAQHLPSYPQWVVPGISVDSPRRLTLYILDFIKSIIVT